ncbi:hypothetical protein HMPREF9413_5922 [Paenibacillus sp. HGF7]|nr:hypothetical protein HMPREF9413_5922 [Paenibacillus sp. HGF7]EPD80516.1 hypothetical protein HMPREF1207_05622 [Paenibacillus sp. HGH0039]
MLDLIWFGIGVILFLGALYALKVLIEHRKIEAGYSSEPTPVFYKVASSKSGETRGITYVYH